MEYLIETERLHIRKFNEQDADFIFQLLNSPGWLQYIGDRNIKSLEEARQYIVNAPLLSYLKFGFGPYLLVLKETNTPIGMCSLIKRDTLADVDIGFALISPYCGKGYAFEASRVVITYAETVLRLKKLVAITNTDNTSSIQLLKKLGFRFENTIKLPGEENELFFFSYLLKAGLK